MSRKPADLSTDEHQRVLALFVDACRLGVELRLTNVAMAGILAGFSKHLEHDDRPMQYYVDHPLGYKSGEVS